MSGDSIVVDTSLIINLFNGVGEIQDFIVGRSLFISVITEIEVLSFAGLADEQRALLKEFISQCHIVDIEPPIKELTIKIRSNSKVKLPDSIIAATAMYYDLTLFTMDKGFKRLPDLQSVILSV